MATIVVACYGALGAAVGFLGRSSFTPEVIDNLFGLTAYFDKQLLTRRVDSGYSRVFIFTSDARSDDTQMLFYATEAQGVELAVRVNGAVADPVNITILLDRDVFRALPVPTTVPQAVVTDRLKFDDWKNIHTLKVIPPPAGTLQQGQVIVVECLVVVYRTSGEEK